MKYPKDKKPIKFIIIFIVLFLVFYYFNIIFLGIISPGNHYNDFLANELNYINGLRSILMSCTIKILNTIGYTAISSSDRLLVAGHGVIQIAYSCLGLGLLSFFAAYVLAYPKPLASKLIFLFFGVITIEFLNVIRFVMLALFWDKDTRWIDHHTIFNLCIYIIIAISLYYWMKANYSEKPNAAD